MTRSNCTIQTMWAEVIWNAVQNKYPDVGRDTIEEIIRNEDNIIHDSLGRQDVIRQIKVLDKIENEWKTEALDRDIVILLYCLAYGIDQSQFHWRTEQLELDDGYLTEVPPDQIESNMFGFWDLLKKVNILAHDVPLDEELMLASQVLTKLVYIHPFPDGNGRVARLMVNLLFRKWGLPYIVIPKVRNSPVWLKALQQTMRGEGDFVKAWFKKWLDDQGTESYRLGEKECIMNGKKISHDG